MYAINYQDIVNDWYNLLICKKWNLLLVLSNILSNLCFLIGQNFKMVYKKDSREMEWVIKRIQKIVFYIHPFTNHECWSSQCRLSPCIFISWVSLPPSFRSHIFVCTKNTCHLIPPSAPHCFPFIWVKILLT